MSGNNVIDGINERFENVYGSTFKLHTKQILHANDRLNKYMNLNKKDFFLLCSALMVSVLLNLILIMLILLLPGVGA